MKRAVVLGAAVVALAVAFPWLATGYTLSVATLLLYRAYTTQAWNVVMGFAGQLSLGHALYVGIGAYAAGGLFYHLGIGPWAGLPLAIVLAMMVGVVIGYLAFRFGVSGVHFALLTIAFAEFTRIGFDHMAWTGGPGGMFLPVEQRDTIDLLRFRGPPGFYYYAMLVLTGAALALCSKLLAARPGYYWRAIRDNEDAAQSLGIPVLRWKLLAMAVSAGMTAVSGVFIAFFNNSLFPEQLFSTGRSIEIILGSVIGGIGTRLGPILGAAVLTVLQESVSRALGALHWELPGGEQVIYGVVLLGVVVFLPQGIWPPLARRLGLPG